VKINITNNTKKNTNKNTNKKSAGGINFKRILVFLAVLALFGLIFTSGTVLYATKSLPAWDPALLTGAKTTFVYDDQGNIAADLHAEENRTEISIDKVPEHLKQAFIATEDNNFYKHHGVDLKGVTRAVLRNFQSGDLTGEGASTITMQLARNAFLSFDKEWERKIKEAILAFKIEANYSKDEILSMYLNKIYFGSGAYGVQAAADTYFGKDVADLSLAECAMLAGIPQNPNVINPFQSVEKAKARQKIILNNMVKGGYIDKAAADDAYKAELVYDQSTNKNTQYGYFVDAVLEEALDILENLEIYDDPNNAIYKSGLKIYTTMNADLQNHAEALYSNDANFPAESKNGQLIQSAMVLMDHSNGAIKAVMGGRKYEQRRGFNRATSAYRQPGSAIKPIAVYSPALEAGIMPYYVLDDSPISLKIGNSVWSPKNYDLGHRGLITMRTAVQYSINTYAVQLLDQIGIGTSFDFAKSLGLELLDTPGTNDLGLAPLSLGGLTKGATPMQMAAAYGAIGNGGVYVKPHFITKIVDEKGIEIYNFELNLTRVMSDQTSWLMTNMLQTVTAAGTGTNAKVPGVPTAGKTGTSEHYKDSWFCGFTPGYSVSVWMGYDEELNMNNVYGGGFPAKIFRSMLQKAHEINNPSALPMPGGIVQVQVCSKSGLLPGENCSEEALITDYSRRDCIPTETCDIHEVLLICPESGKLAGKYCPDPEMKAMVKTGENSADKDRIPTEKCDIHTEPTFPGMFKDEVYVCLDDRHDGKLHLANVANPLQSGGCPRDSIIKVKLDPGQHLPYCDLEDHQIKKKKARDIIDDIID
jgi:penicillin-binding protein 1A